MTIRTFSFNVKESIELRAIKISNWKKNLKEFSKRNGYKLLLRSPPDITFIRECNFMSHEHYPKCDGKRGKIRHEGRLNSFLSFFSMSYFIVNLTDMQVSFIDASSSVWHSSTEREKNDLNMK